MVKNGSEVLLGDPGLQGGYNPENYTPNFLCVYIFLRRQISSSFLKDPALKKD